MLQKHSRYIFFSSVSASTKLWPVDLCKPYLSTQAMFIWHQTWGLSLSLFFLWRCFVHFGERAIQIQDNHLHSWNQNQIKKLLKKLSSWQWLPELHVCLWKGETPLEAQSSWLSLPTDTDLRRLPIELTDTLAMNSMDQSGSWKSTEEKKLLANGFADLQFSDFSTTWLEKILQEVSRKQLRLDKARAEPWADWWLFCYRSCIQITHREKIWPKRKYNCSSSTGYISKGNDKVVFLSWKDKYF